jgi:hypothetical protein
MKARPRKTRNNSELEIARWALRRLARRGSTKGRKFYRSILWRLWRHERGEE